MSELNAGRELDALVAERVMGLTSFKHDGYDGECAKCGFEWDPHRGGPGTACPIPDPYSTDIAAAWEVVEKLCASGKGFTLEHPGFSPGTPDIHVFASFGMSPYMVAETAPLAICRAALKAVAA